MIQFSIRLRELRNSKNLTQQKLAEYLKTSKSSINMYERGEREPRLDMLEAIADFFNVDLDYLLGKSDIPNRALIQSYNLPDITPPSEVDPDMFILHMYKKLDTEDKAEIRGEMKQMLKADKYLASNDSYVKIAAKGQGTIQKLITDEQRRAAFDALYELDNKKKK